MQFTKKYSVVSFSQGIESPEKKTKKLSGVGAFTSIKKTLDQIATRVGSSVGIDHSQSGAIFFLTQRPKDRQRRLDWNQEVDRVSTLCRERLANYSTSVIVGRTGNQIEFKRKRQNVKD